MTGTIWELALAAVAFVGGHFLLSSLPLRGAIIGRAGETAFRGLYSVVAAVALIWLIIAYGAAPYVEVWPTTVGLRHLALTVMPFACILVVAGATKNNPTSVGQKPTSGDAVRGMAAITRHPMMWGFALWGLVHLTVNGDLATIILAGAIALLALLGTLHIDYRRARTDGEAWRSFAATTSNLPFAAVLTGRTRLRLADIGYKPIVIGLVLYGLLLLVHPWLSGGMTALP